MDISWLNNIDWLELKKLAIKYFDKLVLAASDVNWGYVGIGMFVVLMGFYIYDTVAGTQISPLMLIGVMLMLAILAILGQAAVGSL